MKNDEGLETVPIFNRIDPHIRIAHVVSTDITLCLYLSENNKASRNIGVDPQRGAERHKCRLGLEYARFKSNRPGKLISATSNKNVSMRQCTMYIYGSVCAGREFSLFKVESPCDQTC